MYTPGQTNQYFNYKLLILSLLKGIFVSLCVFFFAYGSLLGGNGSDGKDIGDLQTLAIVVQTSIIFVVTFQVALDTCYWTYINHYFYWGSLFIYFILTFTLNSNGLFGFLPSSFPFFGEF